MPLDATRHLTTSEAQSDLLSDSLEPGERAYIAAALGTIARARGLADVAQAASLTREGLYKALSPTGDPRLSSLIGVMKVLNLEFRAVPVPKHEVDAET